MINCCEVAVAIHAFIARSFYGRRTTWQLFRCAKRIFTTIDIYQA